MKEFTKDLKDELLQITWPKTSTVVSFTVTVVIVSIIIGYILGAFDGLFALGVKYILSNPIK